MPEKILSVCIPTYNRADILDKTLSGLVSEPSFQSGKIEICISDNASTDNSETIVKNYTKKYSNIIYSRNTENTGVADGNFPKAAALGTGSFIKLLNDYAYFIPEELDKMIGFIEGNMKDKPLLLFPNNNLIDRNDEIIYCDSLEMFVQIASYWSTWLLATGIWREDFVSMPDRDRNIEKLTWTPDLNLRTISSKKRAVIYNRQFCKLQPLKSKGGYNFFQVFGVNYLSLYDEYLATNQLSQQVYNVEKYRLFRYYLLGWYKQLVISKNDIFQFEKQKAFQTLLKNYRFKPYFYTGIISLYLRRFLKLIIAGDLFRKSRLKI